VQTATVRLSRFRPGERAEEAVDEDLGLTLLVPGNADGGPVHDVLVELFAGGCGCLGQCGADDTGTDGFGGTNVIDGHRQTQRKRGPIASFVAG
jgi:hypothetical protein